MVKASFSVVCILLGVLGVLASPPIRIAPSIYITPAEEGAQSSLGVVNGVRSCGGRGTVIQLRYETCEGSGTCQIPADGQMRQAELEFIPSEDISSLGIRFLVITDGEVVKAYERPISDSQVEGGHRYIVHSLGGASEDLKDKTVTIQYMLYKVDNGDVEICSEAEIQVV